MNQQPPVDEIINDGYDDGIQWKEDNNVNTKADTD